MLGYIKTIVRDEHLAEDILQNVFVKLWKVEPQSIDNIKAYLFTIARNESFTGLNKKQKQNLCLKPESCTILETIDAKKMSIEEALSLEDALLQLPFEQREIIYLKIYADFTFQKIAETLQISINTAASRYRYAMEKLQELLGDSDES